jgi:hypothetical protein
MGAGLGVLADFFATGVAANMSAGRRTAAAARYNEVAIGYSVTRGSIFSSKDEPEQRIKGR